MATKIVTKNSSTSGSAPSASDLVQGELAVNVVDKRLYTENNSGAIVELGTNPAGAVTMASTLAVTGNVDFNGDLDVDGTTNLDVVDIDGAVDMASTLTVATKVFTPFVGSASDTDTNIYFPASNQMRFLNGGVETFRTLAEGSVFNEAGVDIDFRVESDGNANMLFVDGGTNRVGIGTGVPSTNLHIKGGADMGIRIEADSDGYAQLQFGDADDTVRGAVAYNNSTDVLELRGMNNAIRFQIAADGSLSTPTLGTSNVRFGVNAGNSIASGGNYNTVVGDEAGTAITTGDQNVAIGFESLKTEDTGSRNTAVGAYTLNVLNNDAQSYNTAMGYAAGLSVTTGIQNTIIGGLAGDSLTTGSYNVALGMGALTNDDVGSRTTAIGYDALSSQNYATATDSYNTAVGYLAGAAVTTGTLNTLIGGLTGDAITTGNSNVALGYNSLGGNTAADHNVAIGINALAVHNTSDADNYNTAVGSNAGASITSGAYNTIVGGQAGDGMTTARFCTAVGVLSLSAANGDSNTAFGYSALAQVTGEDNIALGVNAGDTLISGNNTILIGVNADPTSESVTNGIAIGTGVLVNSNDFSFGKVSNVVTNDFDADANWSRSSDERLKKNITNQTLGLDFINDLRTVKYNWKANGDLDAADAQLAHLREEDENGDIINYMNTDVTMHNFIAQEVKAALDTAGVTDFGGWKEDQYGVQQVSREMFVIPLVKAVQEQNALIEALTARIETLEG